MLEMVANWPQNYIEAWKMCITLQKNFHVPHNTDLYCKKNHYWFQDRMFIMYDINAYKCTLKCLAGSFHYVCSTAECLLWKAITINCSGNWVILLKHVTSSSWIQTRYVPFISGVEFMLGNIKYIHIFCHRSMCTCIGSCYSGRIFWLQYD